jgi:hypothetical protein
MNELPGVANSNGRANSTPPALNFDTVFETNCSEANERARKPVWMQIGDFADQWAFLAKYLGMAMPGTPAPPAD